MEQELAPATINVSGSEGLQVGTGNVQHNNWTVTTPPAPASLSALSPRRAVARLRQMSLDEAVHFFAGASLDDASEILGELLRADESKAISILAELNPRTSWVLIRTLTHDFPWLVDLPKAVEAIASRAAAFELDDDLEAGQLERIARAPGGRLGYVRKYEKGVIYWSEGIACAVVGQIAEYYVTTGGSGGALGFPMTETAALAESQHAAKGMEQRFEEGIVCSSDLGTYAVSGRFNRAYRSAGGASGRLGFPTGVSEPYDNAEIQRFEGGVIYASAHGAYPVRKAFDECAKGWLPVSPESDAGSSSVSGQSGRMQKFRGIPGRTGAVYSSDRTGIHRVGWEIFKYYQAKGGPTSSLGFPVSGITIVQNHGYFQIFEGGHVYSGASGTVMAPTSTSDMLIRDPAVEARLGWPVSEEKLIDKGDERIQFFKNGVVTRVRKTSEIWLRP